MPMTIDGSVGEGGGQILRMAIAFSAILGESIRVVNIRKNRPKPGLGVQHLKSIEALRNMVDASVEGLYPGSTEVVFTPGPIKSGEYRVNMGTAGSITLALQSILPVAAFAPGPMTVDITGGTDVSWSPTYDYFKNVTLPAIGRFGFHVEASLISRGYYPAGGGRMRVYTKPAVLRGVEMTKPMDGPVKGVSSSSRLPPHVAERQARAAKAYLIEHGFEADDVVLDVRSDTSTGSSITLFRGMMGGSALGERGKPAEKVGVEAASFLAEELSSGAAVDSHLADQLIIYMALSDGQSMISTSHITDHTRSSITIAEQMTGKKFTIRKNRVYVIQS
ncbi:RNA 3'-terminal phosphate cyclase [Methanocella conradii]|uniref:RNA 3'-terminal phosphate cyclase n=1 Tax=Methanocella conradii TaxID=1175444 RepID=UPI00157C69FD|nr:RNA 3'-terminal phosphate cyclase [Methanocella conradii]